MSSSEKPEIPRTAFVPCPKAEFRNVRACEHCSNCPHLVRMVRVGLGGTFVQQWRVGCGHPVTRAMIHVEA